MIDISYRYLSYIGIYHYFHYMWQTICNEVRYLIEQDEYEKAFDTLKPCIDIDLPVIHYYAGLTYYHLREPDQAISHLNRLIETNPNLYMAYYNLAGCYGLKHDLLNAYKYSEYRFKVYSTFALYYRRFDDKHWDGKQKGEKIYVYHEQGMGDMIQYLRFLPLLKNYFNHIIVEAPYALLGLLTEEHGANLIFPRGNDPYPANITEYDYAVSICSLPHLFGVTKDTIPSAPYIYPREIDMSKLKVRPLKLPDEPKIGACWFGYNRHYYDKYRSAKLDDFLPLKDKYKVYNLTLADSPFSNIKFNNMQETANVINQLDMVVTVDTAVAHVAGAMNKPCYMLIDKRSDWRWGIKDTTTHWYPSIKIMRGPFKESIQEICGNNMSKFH